MPTVFSTCLAFIDYNAGTSTMLLVFNEYGAYEYYGVPQGEYDGLLNAGSHGTYFNYSIRNAAYGYAKVG